MGLVNRIIQCLEVPHEPNLTLTEQLITVSIYHGFRLSCANITCSERRSTACRARVQNMARIQLRCILGSRHV